MEPVYIETTINDTLIRINKNDALDVYNWRDWVKTPYWYKMTPCILTNKFGYKRYRVKFNSKANICFWAITIARRRHAKPLPKTAGSIPAMWVTGVIMARLPWSGACPRCSSPVVTMFTHGRLKYCLKAILM